LMIVALHVDEHGLGRGGAAVEADDAFDHVPALDGRRRPLGDGVVLRRILDLAGRLTSGGPALSPSLALRPWVMNVVEAPMPGVEPTWRGSYRP
jgi:hypothetical protein